MTTLLEAAADSPSVQVFPKVLLTRTATRLARAKGVTARRINKALSQGHVEASLKTEGQWVVRGEGLTLIGVCKDPQTFLVLTLRTGRMTEALFVA